MIGRCGVRRSGEIFVGFLSRRMVYDRKRMLERAESLRSGRRWRRALTLYRQLLAAEPRNAELHGRAAPLMARAGLAAEAWESFSLAAEAFKERDEAAKRLKIYERAAQVLPKNFSACRALARAQRANNDEAAALATLLRGAERLKGRRSRSEAILLLREAAQIAPKETSVVLALSKSLARAGRGSEALFLLDRIEGKVRGHDLARVRAQIWRIEPSLKHSWRAFTSWRAVRGTPIPGTPGARVRA